MLAFITMATLSAAIWSDPTLQPQLMTGLDVIKPMITTVTNGKLSTEDARDLQAAALEKAPEVNSEDVGLPKSTVPVNRPETDG